MGKAKKEGNPKHLSGAQVFGGFILAGIAIAAYVYFGGQQSGQTRHSDRARDSKADAVERSDETVVRQPEIASFDFVIRSDQAESVTLLPDDLFHVGLLADGSVVLSQPVVASDGSGDRAIMAWKNGEQRELHRVMRHGPLEGWKFSVLEVSENGAVAGLASREANSEQSDGVIRLFVISADGQLILTESEAVPYDVSDDGRCIVVQDNEFHAVDRFGEPIDLQFPGRAFQTMPIAISDNGIWIAGTVWFIDDYGNETSRAVRWRGTEYELFDPHDQFPRSHVEGQSCLANDGTVIGASTGLKGSADIQHIWRVGAQSEQLQGGMLLMAAGSADQIIGKIAGEEDLRLLAGRDATWIDLLDRAFQSKPSIDTSRLAARMTSTGFAELTVTPTTDVATGRKTIIIRLPE